MTSHTEDDIYEHSDGEEGVQGHDDANEGDIVSPVDGYFGSQHQSEEQMLRNGPMSGQVPVVPNVMVEDPSLQQGSTAHAKAREAAEEQASRLASERRQSETPQSPAVAQPSEADDEDEGVDDSAGGAGGDVIASPVSTRSIHAPQHGRGRPLHPNQHHIYTDAPPAYSPGPSRSYGTMAYEPTAPHDAHGEQQPLLTPASPFPEPDMPQGPWRGFTRSKASWGFRKKATFILVAMVIAILIIVMAVGYLINSRPQSHDYIEEPVDNPDLPSNFELRWQPPPQCNRKSNSIISLGHAYTFRSYTNLTIIQKYEEQPSTDSGRPLNVFGEIHIRPATNYFYAGGYYEVQTISNGDFGFSISAREGTGTLKIVTTRHVDWEEDMEPCLQMRFTLFVPPDGMLGKLDIQTEHLGIRIIRGLSMGVVDDMQMLTYSGDIIAPEKEANDTAAPYRIECPRIVAQSIGGLIKGWFPLYDDLTLITRMNNVAATIGQKLVKSWRNPPPAKLTVQSMDGNINVREMEQHYGRSGAVPRDHRVAMESNKGDISAETIYSSSAEFKTTYGNLNLSVSPAAASDCLKWGYPFCWISTDAGANGMTYITVNAVQSDIVSAGIGNMSALQSSHVSSAGDIVAMYPGEWEGTLVASSLGGDMNYTGKGLVMKPWDAVNKRMRGKKGDGSSFMNVGTRDGNQRVMIGDE